MAKLGPLLIGVLQSLQGLICIDRFSAPHRNCLPRLAPLPIWVAAAATSLHQLLTLLLSVSYPHVKCNSRCYIDYVIEACLCNAHAYAARAHPTKDLHTSWWKSQAHISCYSLYLAPVAHMWGAAPARIQEPIRNWVWFCKSSIEKARKLKTFSINVPSHETRFALTVRLWSREEKTPGNQKWTPEEVHILANWESRNTICCSLLVANHLSDL